MLAALTIKKNLLSFYRSWEKQDGFYLRGEGGYGVGGRGAVGCSCLANAHEQKEQIMPGVLS